MGTLTAFGKVAPYLSHPLTLVGYVLLLFFGIHRVLIRSGIIPPLFARLGGKIVQILLRYGFIIAVLVILMGFALEFWKKDPDVRECAKQALQRIDPSPISELTNVPKAEDIE